MAPGMPTLPPGLPAEASSFLHRILALKRIKELRPEATKEERGATLPLAVKLIEIGEDVSTKRKKCFSH
jgi:hypothetical protein